uniref:Uncharacterized protein n=1 Tax=Rhizophora mucronata TaxID=61149 RepID=A0A2P2N0S0_RHIMU
MATRVGHLEIRPEKVNHAAASTKLFFPSTWVTFYYCTYQ